VGLCSVKGHRCGWGKAMRELDPLACEPPFGLGAGVSTKPNLTSNRPVAELRTTFFLLPPISSLVTANTCLSSTYFLDAVKTSSVGVLSTEYELNTTCSLQVLDDLDSSQVAPRCRSTITCIFILHFEALSSRSSIVRG
jgi:hypothetical protein